VLKKVCEIRSLTSSDQWRHCPGAHCNGDYPSRGLETQKLRDCTVWWEGPPFLKSCQEEWPDLVDSLPSDTAMAELMKTSAQDIHVLASVASGSVLNLTNVIDCNKFSSFKELLKVTAHVLIFVERCRGSPLQVSSVQYSNSELEGERINVIDLLHPGRSILPRDPVLGWQLMLW